MSLEAAVLFVCKKVEGIDFTQLAKPIIVGISGPQGLGKSWLTSHLKPALESALPRARVVEFSMDDLYLTHDEQAKVTANAKKDDNKMLQGRGLPGTHDLPLAMSIFDALKRRTPVNIPRYDKSAFKGEGDRSSQCTTVDGCDIVLFEGWFNGFKSTDTIDLRYLEQGPGSVVQKHKMYHIRELNSALKEYEAIWRQFDEFIYLETDNLNNVYKWRLEQEHALIRERGVGMTDDEVTAFVDRYMPVYSLYYRDMCAEGVCTPGHNLQIPIGSGREMRGDVEIK